MTVFQITSIRISLIDSEEFRETTSKSEKENFAV